jgi:hypothetical protein
MSTDHRGVQTGMRPRPLEPDASMTKRAHWLDRRMMLASLLLLPLVAGPALATDQQPSDFVAAIYRLAMGPSGDGSDGGSVFADAANSKRFLSRRLRAALKTMLKRTPKGAAPSLDFDPITNGNDPSVHDLHIKTESDTGTSAVVVADFLSHQDTARSVLRYFLVREKDGWKVDDIVASGKNDWRVTKLIEGP